MLVVISGLPGTGKTTVSKEIANQLKAEVLSTDRIRKKMSNKPEYTQKRKRSVYREMFQQAQDLLSKDENVILDATFFKKEWRDQAFKIGKKAKGCVFLIKIVCPEDTVKKRIHERYKNRADYSDADYRVYKMIKNKFESIKKEHFVIHTGDDKKWKEESLEVVNKMRIVEKQDRVIDVLKKKHKMKLLHTHISWVLLDGHHAFKVKKPVLFSFVDYSTLQKRKYYCEKENELNAMLSSNLYLGVVPIKKKDGTVNLNQNGAIIEYAVKMVELPQSARMDHLLKEKKINQTHIKKIAQILEQFHQRTNNAPKKYGLAKTISENFSPIFEIIPLIEEYLQYGERLEMIKSKVESFIQKNKDLFEQRILDKRIKRCHGDVRTKNIFIHKKEIYIFDSIEFNEKIASCDVAAEVAFLAMDLNIYGKEEWADVLVKEYIKLSGDNDIMRLIDFYICYRALVEALVETYKIDDPEIGEEKKRKDKKDCKKKIDLAFSFSEKINQ